MIFEVWYIRLFSEKGKREKLIFFFKYSEYYEGFILKINFVFVKVDLLMFLILMDDDFKELGIVVFGVWRKMFLII